MSGVMWTVTCEYALWHARRTGCIDLRINAAGGVKQVAWLPCEVLRPSGQQSASARSVGAVQASSRPK